MVHGLFLRSAHLNILREARSRGSHLLVGVHSDDVLRREFDGPVLENFEQRLDRIMENRHVSSVLKDAPWRVTADMLNSLGIKRVIRGSICKVQDGGKANSNDDPYKVAIDLGILEIIPSFDETTERSMHEVLLSPCLRVSQSPRINPCLPAEVEAFML